VEAIAETLVGIGDLIGIDADITSSAELQLAIQCQRQHAAPAIAADGTGDVVVSDLQIDYLRFAHVFLHVLSLARPDE
jgi:hypothetical protein